MRRRRERRVHVAGSFLAPATVGLLLTSRLALASDDELRTGFLFRSDVTATSLVAYNWSNLSVVGASGESVHLEDVSFLPGAAVSINVGYSHDAPYRVGLGCTGQFGLVAGGGNGIPFTQIDGLLRLHFGPTFGFRWGARLPLELEVGLSYVRQDWIGSQVSIGSPQNGFPIDRGQQGALVGALVIWRPLGPRSIFGVAGGLDTSWTFVETPRGGAHAVTTGARLGVSVGL